MFPSRTLRPAVLCLAALAPAPPAAAITLLDSRFDIFVNRITPQLGIPPGVLISTAGSDDPAAADGTIEVKEVIGTSSSGTPVTAAGGVDDYGAVFYALADSPNNFQLANITNIGSSVEVLVYRDYVKDHVDDKLTYTYTHASLNVSMNPEFGPVCPPLSQDTQCMRAGMFGSVTVLRNGAELWKQTETAEVYSDTTLPNSFDYGFTGDFPWIVKELTGGGGFKGMQLFLDQNVTRSVDLSGVGVGQVFTVQYQLFAYGYDRGSHLGLQRDASAFIRDPLGGSGGVGFQEISGGTPQPSPVPLPAAGWLLMGATAALAAAGRARRPR